MTLQAIRRIQLVCLLLFRHQIHLNWLCVSSRNVLLVFFLVCVCVLLLFINNTNYSAPTKDLTLFRLLRKACARPFAHAALHRESENRISIWWNGLFIFRPQMNGISLWNRFEWSQMTKNHTFFERHRDSRPTWKWNEWINRLCVDCVERSRARAFFSLSPSHISTLSQCSAQYKPSNGSSNSNSNAHAKRNTNKINIHAGVSACKGVKLLGSH